MKAVSTSHCNLSVPAFERAQDAKLLAAWVAQHPSGAADYIALPRTRSAADVANCKSLLHRWVGVVRLGWEWRGLYGCLVMKGCHGVGIRRVLCVGCH
jgi:hypothetical protein